MFKKFLYFLLVLIIISGCQRREVINTHGISYLEKREKLIFVNKTNKNDTIKLFGQPSTKGMSNDNLWILINMYVIFLELELIYIKYGDGDVFN